MSTIKPSRLIIFEGMDGVGKTTQLREMKERLERAGHDVVTVAEPGGTILGQRLREILLDSDIQTIPEEMLLLFTMQRMHLLRLIVIPALLEGKMVLADRSIISTYVYQHQYGVSYERITEVSRIVLEMLETIEKDVFILDLPAEDARNRALGLGLGDISEEEVAETSRVTNHFDLAEITQYQKRRSLYHEVSGILKWENIHFIDARQSPEIVSDQLWSMIVKSKAMP